ncbi:HNH endonuclease signature motif containing protein [Amycolatopsis nigrescens]|uniref:HNH endonuclease signature motif containing protein n=1 Tax=Amycolatopsis nigrescens TaxID=381445 RepID=UPI00036DBC36|nr:HNH endonuclease signature motif containing protein [Amycolatopsis nigrescens]
MLRRLGPEPGDETLSPSRFFGLSAEAIGGFSDAGSVEAVVASRRLRCQLDAVEVRFVARFSALRGGVRSVVDELAPELRLSREATATRVALSVALVSRLPCLLAAMEEGELDIGKARQAFDGIAVLPDELVGEADRLLAERIGQKSPSNWRKAVTHVVAGLDPEGQKTRAAARRLDRKVELIHEPDAMASLWAYLPAEIAAAVYARVDALARKLHTRDESRTMDQLRADMFTELLLGQHGGIDGVAVQVFIHIPLDTALGIREDGCELVGHGPIPGEVGRHLMNHPDSVWRRVLTDPVSGTVRDVGRTRYRPPADLAELVQVRDRTCRAPGCNRPAQRCDTDHCTAWSQDGDTCEHNLCCLCRYHHRLKDEPGWTFDFDPDTADLTVTTPTGRTYTTRPEPLVDPAVPSSKNDDEPPPF